MKAVVRKEKVMLTTYPYSDPAPLAEFGRIYPYNRYDGYALEGGEEVWEMIVLENSHIKVWINPAVGGKVWGAVEKSTGKEFIYFNHTAKFRDVAMRGPWTSGGIEFNVGILGHALSCSSPVDHHTRDNGDGSVSCFIGATDWPSRTRWFVEISLRDDAAWFLTRTSWYNGSETDQAYYSWSNAGIKTSGDLEYIFPGHAYLGHDGKAHSWPVDSKGRDLSKYENNDFGHYKSYHVIGSPSDCWGCYWQKDRFGMAHYSPYDQKPGKKIWIWGLSRYGMIWEDLLTDEDGQYTEVQSGRLLNQSISQSSATPFKHRSFLPGAFDVWDEYWMPVKETGGLSYACPELSFYIGGSALQICASQPLAHVLKVEDKSGVLAEMELRMEAMAHLSVPLSASPDEASVRLWLNDVLVYDAMELKHVLKRPTEITPGYEYGSVEGLYLQGKEWERQRFFARARDKYAACLAKDAYYIRALTGMAALKLRMMDYDVALGYLVKALSVDNYDAEANYLYGLVHFRIGNIYDAKDGFSIASQSMAYRTAALTGLARLMIRQQQYSKALGYLDEALASNTGNCQAYQLQILVMRKMGNKEAAVQLAQRRLQKDPLDHLLRYEIMKADKFVAGIGSEWPHETFIELASFYTGVEDWEDASGILSLAPEHPMVLLWKAYVHMKQGQAEQTVQVLAQLSSLSPGNVFPHRHEDIAILRWAVGQTESWKVKYFLALGLIQSLKEEEALALLAACGNEPAYYPFYMVRAGLNGRESDVLRAVAVAPDAWRTAMQLSKFYVEREQWAKALDVAQEGYTLHPGNYYLGLLLAKCYMYNDRFEAGIGLMKALRVLPNEGASEGRNVWRETNLHAAIAAILKNKCDVAVGYIHAARAWPENIGVGRPYDVDERLEDFLEYYCLIEKGSSEAGGFKERIISFRDKHPEWPVGSSDLLPLLFEEGVMSRRQWIDRGNDNVPLRWCKAFLEGNKARLAELTEEKYVLPEALPYEILFEDREFTLIRKMYTTGLLTTKN
jgi:tetratricopeptide (TPR) repeat protein